MPQPIASIMSLREFLVFLLFISFVTVSRAQWLPLEGSVLNSRLVGFKIENEEKASFCKLEVATGYYNNVDSFLANRVIVNSSDGKNILQLLPFFGTIYTWRVLSADVSAKKTKSPLRHFSIGQSPFTDTSKYRLKVVRRSADTGDFFVFLDANRTLYDKDGRLIWYLPELDSPVNESTDSRDIKVSCANTITLLLGGLPYEIDYYGKILWHSSKSRSDSEAVFHHEFVRLQNGRYMALKTVFRFWKFPDDNVPMTQMGDRRGAPTMQRPGIPARINCKLPFGEVVEMDEKGKELWRWSSFDYFDTSDLKYRQRPLSLAQYDVHDNAFFLDEKRGELFVSFKNINRIVKVGYPAGGVLASFGHRFLPNGTTNGPNHFCFQHSCKISPDGSLYLFNNGCDASVSPAVDIYNLEGRNRNELKKSWTMACRQDSNVSDGKRKDQHVFETMGGNVMPLPNNRLYLSFCSPYSKLMIVDKATNVFWEANPEKWNSDNGRWEPFVQYRSSIIGRAQLEKLIWAATGER